MCVLICFEELCLFVLKCAAALFYIVILAGVESFRLPPGVDVNPYGLEHRPTQAEPPPANKETRKLNVLHEHCPATQNRLVLLTPHLLKNSNNCMTVCLRIRTAYWEIGGPCPAAHVMRAACVNSMLATTPCRLRTTNNPPHHCYTLGGALHLRMHLLCVTISFRLKTTGRTSATHVL